MIRLFAFSLLATFPLLAHTQSVAPVVSVFIPGYPNQTFDASVVAVKAQATTYILNCPPTEDPDNCGLFGPVSYTVRPSTIDIFMDYTTNVLSYTQSVHCTSSDASTIVCTEEDFQIVPATTADVTTFTDFSNIPLTTIINTTVSTVDNSDITMVPITITAGASLISGSIAAPTVTSTPSSSETAKSSNAAAANIARGAFGLGVAAIAVAL
jgi:hypothetical protein